MNKKYFSILVVAIVATVASFNIYSSQKETPMSDLTLANVEALAQSDGEVIVGPWYCVGSAGICYNDWQGTILGMREYVK